MHSFHTTVNKINYNMYVLVYTFFFICLYPTLLHNIHTLISSHTRSSVFLAVYRIAFLLDSEGYVKRQSMKLFFLDSQYYLYLQKQMKITKNKISKKYLNTIQDLFKNSEYPLQFLTSNMTGKGLPALNIKKSLRILFF